MNTSCGIFCSLNFCFRDTKIRQLIDETLIFSYALMPPRNNFESNFYQYIAIFLKAQFMGPWMRCKPKLDATLLGNMAFFTLAIYGGGGGRERRCHDDLHFVVKSVRYGTYVLSNLRDLANLKICFFYELANSHQNFASQSVRFYSSLYGSFSIMTSTRSRRT